VPSISRYTGSPRDYQFPDGRTVQYLAPRILPAGGPAAAGGARAVQQDEVHRLDLIAARLRWNPLLAWRIADINEAMDPMAVCATAGMRILLPRSEL
jgi:hypothetical protein